MRLIAPIDLARVIAAVLAGSPIPPGNLEPLKTVSI
jgi:hypothetical protein